MELISTIVCKASDIGVHRNMFGGHMMALIDEAAAVYSAQICDTPRMVTIKIAELIFKQPVKVNNIIKFYGRVEKFGNTSVTMYIEARKHNVYTGVQEVVTQTSITFVRIDDEGNPLRISNRIKDRYWKRVDRFGKGLLSTEEREIEEQKTIID
jgi:acyl-CoA thioesterase YciA